MLSGEPLETPGEAASIDWCTASCPFNDRLRVALARLEVAPTTTTPSDSAATVVLTVFDLVRNESVRHLRHSLQPVGGARTRSRGVRHVTVSTNDRYVVSGLQRGAVDEQTLFVVFDLNNNNTDCCATTLLLDATHPEVFILH